MKNRSQMRIPVGYISAALIVGGIATYEISRNAAAKKEALAQDNVVGDPDATAQPTAAQPGDTVLSNVAASSHPGASPHTAVRVDAAKAGSARNVAIKDTVFAEGRLVAATGFEVDVASEVSGRIAAINFAEQAEVKKGDILVELGTEVERAELAEAQSRYQEAKVELAFLEHELARTARLRQSAVLAQIEFDKVEHQANAARARLKTMSLQTAVLQQRLEKAQIIAPISGRVVEQLINLGEVIEPGVPLVRLVDFQQVRVEAEVGEFDIPRVALGASVTITAEGFDGQSWSGTIVEVPDWVTSRRLKPLDPGRPSDTRVLPVQTTLPVGHPLKLGQRVEVQIRDTRP